jgi:predicted Zn-dependent peptidase
VRVGSIHERPGITGISHLFEHLMFRGAKRYGPGEFDRLLELNGGESNAFTDKDMTAYYEDIVSDQLPLVVDLDSDRLASLDVTAEVLGPERDVVKEERRLRAENNVVGALDETLEAAAYHAHPYGWPVLGWMGDLDNITVEDCREFFRTHYAPNNATLIVVGDFDTPALHALVEKSYASIAQQPAIRPVPNSEPSQRGQRRLTLRKEAQVESFAVAYHVPPAGGAGFYALEVLQYILGSGRSSRLYRRLVYDSQAAQSVVAFNGWNKHPSLFKVFVDMRPGRTAVEGEMMLEEEIGRLVTGGVEERELQKAKNNIRASFIRQLKTNNGKGQVAGQFELLWGDWAAHARFLAQIDAVTREEVAKAARTFLAEDNKTIVLLVPPAQAKEDGEGPEGEEGVEGGPGRKAGEAEAVGAGRSAGKGGEE